MANHEKPVHLPMESPRKNSFSRYRRRIRSGSAGNGWTWADEHTNHGRGSLVDVRTCQGSRTGALFLTVERT